MKIWTGKLTLNGERKKPGVEVEARIVLGASVMFEVKDTETDMWRTCDADEIHAESWLRALAETGKEVP